MFSAPIVRHHTSNSNSKQNAQEFVQIKLQNVKCSKPFLFIMLCFLHNVQLHPDVTIQLGKGLSSNISFAQSILVQLFIKFQRFEIHTCILSSMDYGIAYQE